MGVGTTEQIVVDARTGLALFGYDPVAYFADGRPKVGRSEIEYAHAGVVWRFGNDGNRAAFVGRPDVYMPRYGGYDPIGVARGVASPGHPLFWLLANDRLYLFNTAETREAFAADPKAAIEAADARWPEVQHMLVP